MGRRATSLGPKPFLVFLLFCFCSFFCSKNQRKLFPPKKGNFSSFSQCLPLFLPSFFHSPFSLSFFFSLSLSLLIFFLTSLFFVLPCYFAFLSCLVSLVWFHEKNKLKLFDWESFFHQSFPFCWFPVLLCLSNLFLLSMFFLILSCVFVQHQIFYLSKRQLTKHQFSLKLGVATKHLFFMACVFNLKSYRFWTNIGQLMLMFRNTVNMVFQHCV